MKKYLLYLILLTLPFISKSQVLKPSTLSTAGGIYNGSNYKVSYTIGQTFFSKLQGGNYMLTQGFQQPTSNFPSVRTVPANRITYNGVNLNCLVNPGNDSTSISFEYGLTTAYGSTANVSGKYAGSTTLFKTLTINGLIKGKTYHYRAIAINSSDTIYGSDRMFTTGSNFSKSSNGEHSIVVGDDGIVYTFGSNDNGQLGDSTNTNIAVPIRVLKGEYNGNTYLGDNSNNPIISVSAGGYHSLALAADGTVYSFGQNGLGNLGDNSTTNRTTPIRVLKGAYNGNTYLGDNTNNPIISISAGGSHSLALSFDGTVYAFGGNTWGQLGDNTTTLKKTPNKIAKGAYNGTSYLGDNPNNPIVSVSAGYAHSLALASDGSVFAFGYNAFGELGDNTTTQRKTPIKVLKGGYDGTVYLGDEVKNPIISLSAGYGHSIVLSATGLVYSFGLNDNGQLGDNTTTDRQNPIRVVKGLYNGTTYLGDNSNNPIISVSGGERHSVALAADGSVFAFGDNYQSQLGDSSTNDRHMPIQVLQGSYNGTRYLGDNANNVIISVTVGGYQTITMSADGILYAFGYNGQGALGDSTNGNRSTPIKTKGVGSVGYLDLIDACKTYTTITNSSCNTYTFNGNVYTNSGTYYDTLTNASGCDSIITLDLTINKSNHDTIKTSACDSYTFKGKTITKSGTYYDSLTNRFGCDSIIVLKLTVNQTIKTYPSAVACSEYYFDGNYLYSSGTYYATFQSIKGCDSIVELYLTIGLIVDQTYSVTACDSLFWGGKWRRESDTYYDTSVTYSGCEVYVLDLTIMNSPTSTFAITACDSYELGGTTYTSSGTYTTKISNTVGCDSIITLILTIKSSSVSSMSAAVCDNYIFGGDTLSASGIYYDTLANAVGCDSIVTLNLTIWRNDTTLTVSACDTYMFDGNSLTASGQYFDTLTNVFGCDSIVTLDLTINNSTSATVTTTACNYFILGNDTLIASGIYADTLSTTNGCDSMVTLNLTVVNTQIDTLILTEISCYGYSNGEISITASGGHAPYMYSLDGSSYQSSNLFTNLVAGVYTLHVMDTNGCAASQNITLTEPTQLQMSFNKTNVGCYGDSSGSIGVDASGGVGGYLYKLNGGNYQTQNYFGGLIAGIYDVTVKDSNACELTTQVTIAEPTKLRITNGGASPSPNSTQMMCYGDSVGLVSVTKTGGTAPYLYKMGNGQFQQQNYFSGLTAGSYQILLQDTNGCADSATYLINQLPQMKVIATIKEPLCYGDSNARLSISVLNGMSPYMYSLNSGNYTTNNTFNNLVSGQYYIRIQDSNGCIMDTAIFINQPAMLSFQNSWNNVLCKGDSSGSVTLGGNGGTAPYQFSFGGNNFSVTNIYNNLTASTYTLRIKDANNCLADSSISIFEPATSVGYTYKTSYTNCAANSGKIEITASGGAGFYTYKMGNGVYQNSNIFSGLVSGNYYISVRDTNGCVFSDSVMVPANNTQLSMTFIPKNICCDGTPTGEVLTIVNGGTPPYLYQVDSAGFQSSNNFTGALKGVYTITAKDSNNCTISEQVTLFEPSQMKPTILWTGAVDTLWRNKDNWNLSRVPNNTDSVYIPSNVPRFPTVTLFSQIYALRIDSGAIVKTISAATLHVKGTISNAGTMIQNGGVFKLSGNSGLPGGNYHALILEGDIKLCGNIALKNTYNMNAGSSLDNRGYDVKSVGDVLNSGLFKGNGKLILERNWGYQTIQGNGSYSNLEVNNANQQGVRVVSDIYITDTLKLSQGSLVINPYKSIYIGDVNTPNGYIHTINGNILSGSSQPSNLYIRGNAQAAIVPNLKLQILGTLTLNRPAGIELGAHSSIAGLDLQSGKINLKGYNLTLGSNNSASGINTTGVIFDTLTGKLQINGNASTPAINNLKISDIYKVVFNRSSGISLGMNLQLGLSAIVNSGSVDLNGNIVYLSKLATISEPGGGIGFKGSSGYLTTTRNYASSSLVNDNIGGLGLMINGGNPGYLTINRGHSIFTNGSGKSISRYYDLTLSNNITASNLKLIYDSAELNGSNRTKLRINQSNDGGNSWSSVSGCVPSTNNSANGSIIKNNILLQSGIKITASDSVNSSLIPITISSNEEEVFYHLFPNPNTGRFTIQASKFVGPITIKLINLAGQTILSKPGLSGTSLDFDISEQAKGFYILEIENKESIVKFKLVKE